MWHVADGTTVCPWDVACDMRWHHVNRNGRGRVPEGTTGCNQGVAQGSARALLMPQPREGHGGAARGSPAGGPEYFAREGRAKYFRRLGRVEEVVLPGGWVVGETLRGFTVAVRTAQRAPRRATFVRVGGSTPALRRRKPCGLFPTCPHRSVQSHGRRERSAWEPRFATAAAGATTG